MASQLGNIAKFGVPVLGVFSAAYIWKNPRQAKSKASSDKKLIAVIAFNRHGDRTPSSLLRGTKTEAVLWKTRVPDPVPLNTWNDVQSQLRLGRLVDDFDPGCGMSQGSNPKRDVNIRAKLPWWCGALTYQGIQQMEQLGNWYRERYGKKFGFLPLEVTGPESFNKVSVHTTNFSRTMMSVDALLVGLFPPNPRNIEKNLAIDIKVNSTGPIWYPNAFHSEIDVFARNEEKYNKQHPNLFNENIKEICEFYASTIPEKAFLLMDPLLYRESTGIDKWAVHLDPTVQDFKDKFDRYYCFKVCRTRDDLKSTVGYLLRYIQDYLENAEDKFTIVCGHDTTLIPVMLSLTNEKFVKIPPYGSSLIFEVWLDESDGKRYVRVLYNQEEMVVYGEVKGAFPLDDLKKWWWDLVV